MRFDSFVGGSYQSASLNAINERTINMLVEPLPRGGQSTAQFLPTPGFELRVTVPEGPIRGIYTLSDPELAGGVQPRVFFVAGAALYELFSDFSVTLRGTVDLDTTQVQWASNGDAGHQLLILSAGIANILDLNTNVFTAAVISNVRSCGLIDGFFFALDPNTSSLWISELLNGLVWPATQVAQRNSASDRWVCSAITHRQVWLWGRQTSDVWWDQGSYPYPLGPIPDAFFSIGNAAQDATTTFGDTSDIVWLGALAGGRAKVYRTQGLNPVPISTLALETEISNYAMISDAKAFSFVMNGHSLYVLIFPTEEKTWVYDDRSGVWTEWLYWDADTAEYLACRVGCHAFGFGLHLVGDRATGKIYEMRPEYRTDVDGAIIHRLRQVAPPTSNEEYVTFYDLFRLDMQTGVAESLAPGNDPSITLSVSFDGGKTWGPEYPCTIGKLGEYKTEVMWRWLGSGRNCVFRVAFADASLCQIATAYLETRRGTR